MAATERVTRARPREMVAVSPTSFVGGAESALLTLLVAARADGWRATVVTPAGEFADRLRDEGFAVVPLPDLKLPAGPRVTGAVVALGRSVQAGLVVRRAAAGADLVLANGTRVLPAVALARVPCPTIHLVRDVIVRRSWRALLRVFGRSATLAVAVDRLLADDRLARQCGQAGMDAVEHHFNTAREQRELVATLDEVATGAGR